MDFHQEEFWSDRQLCHELHTQDTYFFQQWEEPSYWRNIERNDKEKEKEKEKKRKRNQFTGPAKVGHKTVFLQDFPVAVYNLNLYWSLATNIPSSVNAEFPWACDGVCIPAGASVCDAAGGAFQQFFGK